jgi:hypothetical protein
LLPNQKKSEDLQPKAIDMFEELKIFTVQILK